VYNAYTTLVLRFLPRYYKLTMERASPPRRAS